MRKPCVSWQLLRGLHYAPAPEAFGCLRRFTVNDAVTFLGDEPFS
jgi:hypothetical protein